MHNGEIARISHPEEGADSDLQAVTNDAIPILHATFSRLPAHVDSYPQRDE